MNHLQRIRADLLEKRLWPIALLLVVALVAVPVVLRPDAAAESAPDVAADPGNAPSAEATLAAASSVLGVEPPVTVDGRPPKGERRNPFAAPPTPKAAEGTSGSGTSSSGSASGSSGVSTSTSASASTSSSYSPPPSSSSSSGPASVPPSAPRVLPAPIPDAKPEPAEPTTYTLLRTDVRFDGIALPDVVRLRPLPSARRPMVVYLGPTAGGDGAAFVVTGGATVESEGRCRPRRLLCTHLILRPGERATVTVGEERHVLKLVRVREETTTSRAKAEGFYTRQSERGRCVLDVLDFLGYDPESGTVAPHHDARECEYEIGDDGTVGAR